MTNNNLILINNLQNFAKTYKKPAWQHGNIIYPANDLLFLPDQSFDGKKPAIKFSSNVQFFDEKNIVVEILIFVPQKLINERKVEFCESYYNIGDLVLFGKEKNILFKIFDISNFLVFNQKSKLKFQIKYWKIFFCDEVFPAKKNPGKVARFKLEIKIKEN